MPRRQGYALLIALVAGPPLAAAVAFGVADRRRQCQAPARGRAARRLRPPATTGTWVATWTAAPVSAEPDSPRRLPRQHHPQHRAHQRRRGRRPDHPVQPLRPPRSPPLALATRPRGHRQHPAGDLPRPAHRHRRRRPPGRQRPGRGARRPATPTWRSPFAPRTPPGPSPSTRNAHQTSYLARRPRRPARTTRTRWRYLTAVDVRNEASPGAIVVLGDSLTAGSGSTTDADTRWPDVLSATGCGTPTGSPTRA